MKSFLLKLLMINMLIPRIKGRTLPEQIFAMMKNTGAAALVHGDVCIHDTTAADGLSVKQSGTGGAELIVCGVALGQDIAVGDFGRILVYGYHPSLKTSGGTAGLGLKTHTVAGTAANGATADEPCIQFGISISATSGGRSKAWIRAM